MRTFPGCVLPALAGVALLAASALTGCDQPVPDGSVTGECADLSKGEAAWFTSDILPLFETYCTLCHGTGLPEGEGQGTRRGAPRGLDYDVYELAITRNATTWARMADRTMPPMGRMPSTEELETLLEFLNCATAVQASGDDDDSAL